MAEGEGFEPPVRLAADNGFQNRRFRPLSHPSARCGSHARDAGRRTASSLAASPNVVRELDKIKAATGVGRRPTRRNWRSGGAGTEARREAPAN